MKLLRLPLIVALACGFAPFVFAEPQPKMHEALEHLKAAKAVLAHAEHDKGGHRARAIGLIEDAEKQIREGEVFDNRHSERKHRKESRASRHRAGCREYEGEL